MTTSDDQLSYEDARQQLVEIVAKLEGGAPLEESLALWERGEHLAELCQTKLDHARERIAARTEAQTTDDAAQD